jgi:hypothetical protein
MMSGDTPRPTKFCWENQNQRRGGEGAESSGEGIGVEQCGVAGMDTDEIHLRWSPRTFPPGEGQQEVSPRAGPEYKMVVEALREIGVKDSELCQYGECLGDVGTGGGKDVGGDGQVAKYLARDLHWRDLRWAHHWLIVVKGILIKWTQDEVWQNFFRECRFPSIYL